MANIISDFILGINDSIQISLFSKKLKDNTKVRNIIFQIFKFNIITYMCILWGFPVLVNTFFGFDISQTILYSIIFFFINIISSISHIMYFIDLSNIIITLRNNNPDFQKKQSKGGCDIMKNFVDAVTMTLYNLSFSIILFFIDIFTHPQIYYFVFFFKFFLITIYNSFYFFNSYWVYKNINIANRIDMIELKWPYYIGYSTFITIIYLFTSWPLFIILFNLYSILLIINPFLLKTNYDHNMSYIRINIYFLSYITNCICKIISPLLIKQDENNKTEINEDTLPDLNSEN